MARPVKFTITKHKTGLWFIHVPAAYSESGKNQRVYFKKKSDAEKEREKLLERQEAFGKHTVVFDVDDARMIHSLRARLVPYGVSLQEAVDEYIERRRKTDSKKIGEIAELYLRQFSGRSRVYTALVKKFVELIKERFKDVTPEEVMPGEFEAWLKGAARTDHYYNNAIRSVKPMFSWAVRMRYAKEDPVKFLSQVKIASGGIHVLTVDQAQRLVEACRDYRKEEKRPKYLRVDASGCVVPVAVLMFAGIRPTELTRLVWDDVLLSKDMIKISAPKSKTGTLRIVHIEPNLKKFLSRVPETERVGGLVPLNWPAKWKAIRKEVA